MRILDAGCGTGYLGRILARRGARVDGVDVSRGQLEAARAEEKRAALGIHLHQADLAHLGMFRAGTFDAAVSNIVLQDVLHLLAAVREIHRVLRPGGRFVFSITHPAFEAPVPGRWVIEPADSERIEDRKGMLADRYFDRPAVYWGPPGKPLAVGFHRPLRDYFEALSAAGFLVSRYEEPLPLPEALRRFPRYFRDMARLPNFLIIEAVKPLRGASKRGRSAGGPSYGRMTITSRAPTRVRTRKLSTAAAGKRRMSGAGVEPATFGFPRSDGQRIS